MGSNLSLPFGINTTLDCTQSFGTKDFCIQFCMIRVINSIVQAGKCCNVLLVIPSGPGALLGFSSFKNDKVFTCVIRCIVLSIDSSVVCPSVCTSVWPPEAGAGSE